MPSYLHHVTLTTGHVRRSPRSEVAADAVAVCKELIEAATDSQHGVPIPGLPGLRLAADRAGKCILLTVDADDGARVLTIGIATHSRCGAREWHLLHTVGQTGPLATAGQPCPPEPWVGARLEPGAALLSPATIMALSDLEPSLGWAWVEMRTADVIE